MITWQVMSARGEEARPREAIVVAFRQKTLLPLDSSGQRCNRTERKEVWIVSPR